MRNPITGPTGGDKGKTTPIRIGPWTIGGDEFHIMAGPCAVETETQLSTIAKSVKAAGATILRGGIFKMRTHPDSFQGIGFEALDLVKKIKSEIEMPFVSEITDPRQIEELVDVVDVFQVGSRNMYNYSLLKELGQTNKPVLLKRGFSALIEEWTLAAEYVRKGGNEKVILCERGVRSFEKITRNTLDLAAVSWIKQNTDLAVIVDPSHATGVPALVEPMALASVAAGADGLLIETHCDPANALSDGHQALTLSEFADICIRLEKLLPLFGRKFIKNSEFASHASNSSSKENL